MADMWMDVDTALTEVPVNLMPLIDDTDFKTIETAVAYNAAGMDLRWNFTTTAGVTTSTAVSPTTAGVYDWTHQGDGMYTIEIPASGGVSINNNTEGFGWFSGVCTGVLPWRGPVIGFRAAAINNALIDGGDNLDVNTVQVGGQTASATGAVDFDDLATIEGLASGTTGFAAIDTVVDAILVDTGTTIPATLTGIANEQANADGKLDDIYIDTQAILTDTGTTIPALFPANFAALGINVSGHVSRVTLVDTTTANTDMRGTDSAFLAASAPTNFSALGINGSGHVSRVTLVDTTTTNTDMRGTDSAYTGTPPTVAAIADGVWDEAQSGHTTAGTFGKFLDTEVSGVGGGTAADIADAVWDEVLSGHLTAGSTGASLNAAGSAGDPWTTTLPGSYTGTQAGKILADVLTDTAEIGAAGAGLTAIPWSAAWDAEVQSEVADALAAFSWSGITISAVSGAVGSVAGNVGGSVGSISGVTFPSNFSDLSITVTTGLVSVGTNNDKSGYSISGTITTLDDLAGDPGTTLASVESTLVADVMQVQTDVSSVLTDTGVTIPGQITSAFTEIKGATWTTTDTLEQIRDNLGGGGGGGDATEAKQDAIIAALGTPVDLGDGATVAGGITALAGKTANAGSFNRATDSQEAIKDSGAAGGDATNANQLEIISKLSSAVISYTTPTNPTALQLIRGDDYDGVAQSSLTWDMGKNVTGTCTLTIRSKFTDESLWNFTGSVTAGVVTISLTSAQTTTLTAGTFDFDVQVQHSGGEIETISRGALTVIEDQTR